MEDIMNRLSQQLIEAILASIGFIALLGITGTYEYADEVVYTMSDAAYQRVNQDLGGNASKVQIANWYMKNKSYYDNLKY